MCLYSGLKEALDAGNDFLFDQGLGDIDSGAAPHSPAVRLASTYVVGSLLVTEANDVAAASATGEQTPAEKKVRATASAVTSVIHVTLLSPGSHDGFRCFL